MKKLYALSLLLAAGLSYGQVTLPYTESFNYTPGTNLGGQGGWVNVNSGDEVVVTAGNLSYSGLAASSGNMVTFDGIGFDPQIEFVQQTAGTVYASFIINISDVAGLTDPNGGYFAGFGANTTNFASTVWIKPSGAGYVIGLNKATAVADTQYTTTVYALNTDVFVIIAYDFATNTSTMWINPGSLGSGTAPAATLTATTGTNRTSLNRFILRQDSATETPSIAFDELRVATSWGSVTPAVAGIKDNNIAGLKMFPNPLSGNVLNITSSSDADKTVAIFDILGKQVLNAKVTEGTVNVGSLNSGVYIVKITEEGKTATRKLVVK